VPLVSLVFGVVSEVCGGWACADEMSAIAKMSDSTGADIPRCFPFLVERFWSDYQVGWSLEGRRVGRDQVTGMA